MFKALSISGFRRFPELHARGLGRVNLVVGENGAGKTTLLEAVRLLGARGNPMVLLASALARGEYDTEENEEATHDRVAQLRFAFHGRETVGGSTFRIEASADGDEAAVTVTGEIFDASSRDPDAPLLGAVGSAEGEIEWRGMFPEWGVR